MLAGILGIALDFNESLFMADKLPNLSKSFGISLCSELMTLLTK